MLSNHQMSQSCPVCGKEFHVGWHHFATEKLWSHMGRGKQVVYLIDCKWTECALYMNWNPLHGPRYLIFCGLHVFFSYVLNKQRKSDVRANKVNLLLIWYAQSPGSFSPPSASDVVR